MLTTEQLIKIIIGILVFVVVVGGIYIFFKYNVLDFFRNLGGSEPTEIILNLLK